MPPDSLFLVNWSLKSKVYVPSRGICRLHPTPGKDKSSTARFPAMAKPISGQSPLKPLSAANPVRNRHRHWRRGKKKELCTRHSSPPNEAPRNGKKSSSLPRRRKKQGPRKSISTQDLCDRSRTDTSRCVAERFGQRKRRPKRGYKQAQGSQAISLSPLTKHFFPTPIPGQVYLVCLCQSAPSKLLSQCKGRQELRTT